LRIICVCVYKVHVIGLTLFRSIFCCVIVVRFALLSSYKNAH
jgi:hypothetical protein